MLPKFAWEFYQEGPLHKAVHLAIAKGTLWQISPFVFFLLPQFTAHLLTSAWEQLTGERSAVGQVLKKHTLSKKRLAGRSGAPSARLGGMNEERGKPEGDSDFVYLGNMRWSYNQHELLMEDTPNCKNRGGKAKVGGQ